MSVIRTRPGRSGIYSQAITGFFTPGGGVWKATTSAGREVQEIAELTSPSRTGVMASKHGRTTNPARRHVFLTVRNTADYAIYVHEGTTGPIVARNGAFLWVRPFPHSRFPAVGPVRVRRPGKRTLTYLREQHGGRTPVPFVAGQRSQPWLRDAMDAVVLGRFHP